MLICQRYYSESNSQQWLNGLTSWMDCCWYVKDTILKAIHNFAYAFVLSQMIVADMSKILFWKQFTTLPHTLLIHNQLLLICQRYYSESNSQPIIYIFTIFYDCCWYVKDTILKAIHNLIGIFQNFMGIVADMSKILFWKQFTTSFRTWVLKLLLLLICQRYYSESNSQP